MDEITLWQLGVETLSPYPHFVMTLVCIALFLVILGMAIGYHLPRETPRHIERAYDEGFVAGIRAVEAHGTHV